MRNLVDVLEKDWQKQVRQLATLLGYKRAYHTHDSRKSDTGFPDLVLVRDRIIYLELKREKGRLTDTQREWVTALHQAGGEVYVVRPHNFDALAAVLGPKHTPSYAIGRGSLLLELDTHLKATA